MRIDFFKLQSLRARYVTHEKRDGNKSNIVGA